MGDNFMRKLSLVLTTFLVMTSQITLAQEQYTQEQLLKARKIFEKITGTKTQTRSADVQAIAAFVKNDDLMGAAMRATEHPLFLNITVKQMANLMSLREETIRTRLNDFSASFIGATKDGLDARVLLSGNFYYRGDAARIPASVRQNVGPDILNSNNHYNDLDDGKIDIGAVLVRENGQQLIQNIQDNNYTLVANPDPAGVLTSRTFITEHAVAGTNRRPIEYIFRQFMCVAMEDWADTSVSDIHIGPDIDRFPGGDHSKFQTNCKGCHTQMDSLRTAFAYWDAEADQSRARHGQSRPFSNNRLVADKFRRATDVYPLGFIPTNNTWYNNSLGFGNANLFGWRGTNVQSGAGVSQLGTMVANSKRFSLCIAKRVVEATCKKSVDIKAQKADLQGLANSFEASGYKLRNLFAQAAVSPFCG